MGATAAVLIFGVISGAVALWANRRFRSEDRLPMQWWLTGEVTWSAPRGVALAFIPALAAATFLLFALLAPVAPAKPGQEEMIMPAVLGLAAMFGAVQLLHIWLVDRTLRR